MAMRAGLYAQQSSACGDGLGARPRLQLFGRAPPHSTFLSSRRKTQLLSPLRSAGEDPEKGANRKVGRDESKGTTQPLLRQLREAVLSSLDVSEAQMSGDWSDTATSENGNGGSAVAMGSTGAKSVPSLWDTLNSQANSSSQSGKATFEVLRIDEKGGTRISHVRRRDLIRQVRLILRWGATCGLSPGSARAIVCSLSFRLSSFCLSPTIHLSDRSR
jgi:hypothetical protein